MNRFLKPILYQPALFVLAFQFVVAIGVVGGQEPATLPDLVDRLQGKIVKVFGAGAGQVEAYSTGLIVSADGLIVTSQGVYLDGAQTVVVLADGRKFSATIMRRNRRLQLAMLKIDTATPDHFSLDVEADYRQGDRIVAMSNAFRVADKQEPVSAWLGIVSLPTSIDARLNDRDIAYQGELILIDSITSNPGAAGGAVVALDGNLIGVIGKVIESSETNTRLNYAVPARLVRDFAQGKLSDVVELQSPSFVVGVTGIRLFELGGKSAPAYIDRVVEGSPASDAGLKIDDLIVSVNGNNTGNVRECQAELAKLPAGVEAVIIVKRGKGLERFPVTPTVGDGQGEDK